LAAGRSGAIRIVAEISKNGRETALEVEFAEISSQGRATHAAAAGMVALFDTVVELGRVKASRYYHEANKNESVYEFRKGTIRVYFFFAANDGELVVCSHSITKDQRKARKADIDKVVAFRNRYLAAKANATIEIIPRLKK
jgi:crotonobetainyl-CoA:carnitine CoA-transferase CaiB-like acyl-CoA transferase